MDYKNIITIKFAQAEQPRFEEKRAKGYVEFGGNNNYPEYLIGLTFHYVKEMQEVIQIALTNEKVKNAKIID
jgi:hypothetical protein